MKSGIRNLLLLTLLLAVLAPATLFADPGNQYCITPPFITAGVKPNLLLVIDNSSSMYDLAYADEGNKSGTTITREPYYCYDSSYKSLVCSNNPLQSCTAANVATACGSATDTCDPNTYAGYFNPTTYYSYDFTNSYFSIVNTFPTSGCDKQIAGTLCVSFNTAVTPNKASTFVASGNYLNWLTASKFDVEKKVLTGGRFDGSYLLAESRGCVGQGFIKEALAGDFVNYASTGTDDNNQLGITFSVRGPFDSANPSAPSQGGGTVIEIYRGDYNAPNCQAAMKIWGSSTASQNDVRDAIELCLNYNPKGTNFCQSAPSIACTIDANCNGTPVAVRMGGCSNNAATTCTTDAVCGSTTNPGTCSNLGGKSCLVADPDCKETVAGSCSNQVLACSTASQCTIPGTSGTCSNKGTVSCSAAAQCNFAQVLGTCSNRATQTCSADSNCTFAPVQGKCSVARGQSYDNCSSDADCVDGKSPPKYGYCSNPAPVAGSTGTCNGYSAASSGSCNGYLADNTGTCSGGATSTGVCSGITTTANSCNNPAYQPAYTPYYGPCINPDQSTQTKTKITYSHTIQTCWSYFKNGGFSNGDFQRLTNSCDEVLAGWGICSADNSKICTVNTDCSGSGLGTCEHGPSAIRPGNPSLVCGNSYVGQFCTWNNTTMKCTNWDKGSPTAAQKDAMFAQFCDAEQPTVIDPTDSAASSANYEKIPSLLGGIGVEAQLGTPLGTLPVRIGVSMPACTTDLDCAVGTNCSGGNCKPSGLIQEFTGQIRVGAMTFDQFGSFSEASSSSGSVIKLPRVCSNDTKKICNINADCGAGTCRAATSAENLDGGKIIYPVGYGKCATMTTTPCATDAACASGQGCYRGFCGTKAATVCTTDRNCTAGSQVCVASSAGDHATADSLVKVLDEVRANAWTPFAEAFYNVLGYFAYVPSGANEGKSRIDLRLNSIDTTSTDIAGSSPPIDFNENLNPSEYRCQQNYALLISDGSSTADRHADVTATAAAYATPSALTAGTCANYMGSKNLPIMAWIGKNRRLADFNKTTASTDLPKMPRDMLTSYVVYNGGSNGQFGDCDSMTLLSKTAIAGGTTLKVASNPAALSKELREVFQDVAAKAASGTAASILSNSEGSGANILQAVFYPKKIHENSTSVNWTGEMQNLWYFVDPYINNSTIREDTDNDLKLNLVNDYIVRFAFVEGDDKTMVQRFVDSNGDGTADTSVGALIDPDAVKSIWRAGRQLWSRTAARTIKTTLNGTSLVDFASASSNTFAPYLNVTTTEAPSLISWIHGTDQTGYRSRTVDIKDPATNAISSGVWKLGDIISSTPRVQSTVRLNTYNLPAPGGYSDKTYESFINTSAYKSRGMVYVGANDGMLHAFNLGILSVEASGKQKATLSGTNLGKEMWSFIPKNSLPYLKYMADPEYGHLYYIDGRTVVFDASIGDTSTDECIKSTYWKCDKPTLGASAWRSIVIGGMGIGGATAKSCTAGTSCVETPITDPGDTSADPAGLGYSSYFALDVTDPNTPVLLWEFAHPSLGYSTTGPAIVRIGAKDKNGRWLAVFGSGPTGPIDTATHQFQAGSNQSLKYFVVDLRTGALVKIGNSAADYLETGITNAFSGTLLGASIDADRWDKSATGNYQDDAIYVGYVKEKTGGVLTDGGIGRIMIDPVAAGVDPSDENIKNGFRWSKVLDGIGAVTTAVSRLQDKRPLNKNLWLFFGTGRYFYRAGAILDDYTTRRSLYGIKEPCYNKGSIGNYLDVTCSDPQSGSIVDQTSSVSNVLSSDGGWKIDLDASTSAQAAERVVTDTVALTNGAVFFTSFKPSTDICGYGGDSYLWGVKYDTGGQAAATSLAGKALIQLSTGEFKEVDLADAFTDKLNRRMATPMTGKPPSDAPPIVSSSQNKPIKKILHIREH